MTSHVEDMSVPRGTRVSRSRRAKASWPRSVLASLFLVIDLTSLATASADVHGPVRFAAGLLFGLVVVGWSVVGLLPLKDGALLVGLSVSVSLALVMLIVQALMALGAWHLVGLQIVLGVLCAPSLAWQSQRVWVALWEWGRSR